MIEGLSEGARVGKKLIMVGVSIGGLKTRKAKEDGGLTYFNHLTSAWEDFSKPRGKAEPPVAEDTIYTWVSVITSKSCNLR